MKPIHYFLTQGDFMNIRTWTHWLVLLALLVGGLSQTRPAQALTGTDKVIWCPATVIPPTPRKNGCTDAVLSLDALHGVLLQKKPAVAGKIWIGQDYNSALDGEQLWDDSILKMYKYALTIQGGWNGGGTLDPTKPSTFNGKSFSIVNWQGNLTLRNLVVQNSPTNNLCNSHLCVYTKGSIKLDRVQVLNNTGSGGAFLDNTASTSSPPASVTVTNSQFNGNGGDGLKAFSDGKTTLTNVWAEANTGNGVYLFGPSSVFLNGTNTFLSNDGAGLDVYTVGGVTANHLIALHNSYHGLLISALKAVTITGSGIFKGNSARGLVIVTSGPIAAKNLTATSNTDGLMLYTNVPVSVAPQAVTLSNVNADLNAQFGIKIYADGKISVACSSTYANGWGLFVRGATNTIGPAAALKLQGFQSYMNSYSPADVLTATPLVQTPTCPS
jgi:hypothetical protein